MLKENEYQEIDSIPDVASAVQALDSLVREAEASKKKLSLVEAERLRYTRLRLTNLLYPHGIMNSEEPDDNHEELFERATNILNPPKAPEPAKNGFSGKVRGIAYDEGGAFINGPKKRQ